MADPRFFRRAAPRTVAELASLCGAELHAGVDAGKIICDVAPLGDAGPGDLSFLDNIRYRDDFRATRAGACLVAPALAAEAPSDTITLLTANPYKAYALCAQAFYPDTVPAASFQMRWANIFRVGRHTRLGPGTIVERGASVGAGAIIGSGCHIGRHAVIGPNVVLGDGCRIGAHVTISHALIGSNVRIYPGARIGQDGFGFAIDPVSGHVKVPQLGRVIIGDNVEIGANSTIDRGSGPDTRIGDGTWIDNLVQIGHNVQIGKGCVLVAQVGISGSTVIEDYAVFAGQAGIAGHLHIGRGAKVGAKAGVMRDVPAGTEVHGMPAIPAREFMRQVATLSRLINKDRR